MPAPGLIREAQEEDEDPGVEAAEAEAPVEGEELEEAAAEGEAPAAPAKGKQTASDNRMKVILSAMKILYDEKTSDAVVQMLHKGEPPVALAQTALFVMKALHDQSQGSIPPEEMAPSARHVTQLLYELATASGVPLKPRDVAQADQLVQQSMAKRFSGQQAQAQPSAQQPPVAAQPAPQPVAQPVGV